MRQPQSLQEGVSLRLQRQGIFGGRQHWQLRPQRWWLRLAKLSLAVRQIILEVKVAFDAPLTQAQIEATLAEITYPAARAARHPEDDYGNAH